MRPVGQYAEAEAAYRRSEAFCRAALSDLGKWPYPRPREVFLLNADSHRLSIARNEAKQGRLSEAEADARRALLEILSQEGKYNPVTPPFIIGLAGILVEQGRYQESERLARAALDVQRTLGIGDGTAQSASILSELGNILVLQHKNEDATNVYAQLDKAVAQWTPERRQAFVNNSRIVSLYASGQIEAEVNAAEAFVKRQIARTGEKSFDTAAAQGTLAVGYARAGRDADAIREFKTAMPIMMAAAHENSEEDKPDSSLPRAMSGCSEASSSISACWRVPANRTTSRLKPSRSPTPFAAMRCSRRSRDSSARMVAKDPALRTLVRNEQDLAKHINAQLGALNNQLALPSAERDEQTVRAINAALEKLRADRKAARQEIKQHFPTYADLVDPKPPTVDEIKAALRPGEALLSFYFGQTASFVWAVPKDGAIAFAAIPTTAAELETKIHMLRQALEPQITMVSEIPPFDLALA